MAIISGKSLAYINDICIGGGWMNTRGLGAHYAGRARLYGERLQFIRDRGGASLRLDMVHPDLLDRGGSLRITAPLGTIPSGLFGYLKTNGAIAGGRLDIGKLRELFDVRYAFRNREEGFYLRAGEEMNSANMMSAVIGRLVGTKALVPRYGKHEGSVIDAVYTLFRTVNVNDGMWHEPLDEWNEKKAVLDDRGIVVDLSGFDLGRFDLAGINFRNMVFTGANFTGSDQSEADLSFSVVRDVTADRVDYRGAFLMGADFSRSSLMQADFEDAVAPGARFDGAELMMANFFRAMLIGAQFDGSWPLLEGSLRDIIEQRNCGKINGYQSYLTGLSRTEEGIEKLRKLAADGSMEFEMRWFGRTEEEARRTFAHLVRWKPVDKIIGSLMRSYVDRIIEAEMRYSFRGEALPDLEDVDFEPASPLL